MRNGGVGLGDVRVAIDVQFPDVIVVPRRATRVFGAAALLERENEQPGSGRGDIVLVGEWWRVLRNFTAAILDPGGASITFLIRHVPSGESVAFVTFDGELVEPIHGQVRGLLTTRRRSCTRALMLTSRQRTTREVNNAHTQFVVFSTPGYARLPALQGLALRARNVMLAEHLDPPMRHVIVSSSVPAAPRGAHEPPDAIVAVGANAHAIVIRA